MALGLFRTDIIRHLDAIGSYVLRCCVQSHRRIDDYVMDRLAVVNRKLEVVPTKSQETIHLASWIDARVAREIVK